MGKRITIQALMAVAILFMNSSVMAATSQLAFTDTVKEMSYDKLDDPYFEIAEVSVTEIEGVEKSNEEELIAANKDLGATIAIADRLIAFGTKVWSIIKKGEPVSNVNFAQPISIIPESFEMSDSFHKMNGWSAPKSRRYKIDYKNRLGMKVISFEYALRFQFNGEYEGKGNYITGLTVSASNVSVAWGFKINANSELVSISNRGTADSPIAAATMRVQYNVDSVFRKNSTVEEFHVTGEGKITKL